jgi:hypothetical protein
MNKIFLKYKKIGNFLFRILRIGNKQIILTKLKGGLKNERRTNKTDFKRKGKRRI